MELMLDLEKKHLLSSYNNWKKCLGQFEGINYNIK